MEANMFKNYIYEKPGFIDKKNTDALTASFAGGGWLHLNDHRKKIGVKKYCFALIKKEVLQ
jgi:hypothetical protein